MKFLIENTVPFNNGDAALIFAIGDELEDKGHQVTYSSQQKDQINGMYSEKEWIKSPITSKFTRIPFVGWIFMFFAVLKNYKFLSTIDKFITAPGGYVNSYYTSFEQKLKLMILYKYLFKKEIYLYSQSFGPFSAKDEKKVKRVLKHFNLIYARDEVSKKRLDSLDIKENVIQTKDAAFLMEREIKPEENSKKIAISVREWGHDNRSQSIYVELINKIARFFINKGFHVTFLSTCQGLPFYKDDSKLAIYIYENLDLELKKHSNVNINYNSMYELRDILKGFDYIVGTRLHMCILSWLSSTPALNISYEEKGRESYNYLDLSDYTIDYNHEGEVDDILARFLDIDKNRVFERISEIRKEAEVDLDRVIKQ